ncbi:flagellar hook assembly protein FlgD [Halalkalibacillus sediminis]|uniref:Flagellar hook assembly protein FlgD n=1 Tax=Halalkalibacillus sediminis TaxID=2018042 RepID=A0A2I0QWD4_9BACI|nr:flagellar hook assembly protein FlgD [Halalkalibacillus sediminis]PKR78624.1 flagellar hook assembly protein FlgD [Halalkalibacillus sediminis]
MKVDSSLYLSSQNQVKEGGSNLDKDAFLKILMTQLQNQDPMNPMEDKEFISQMATFSQLEQSTNMSSSLEKMIEQQSFTNFLQYSNLIGKSVDYAEYANGEYQGEANGVIDSVAKEGDQVVMKLNDGSKISADQLIQISQGNSGVNEDES